MNANLFTRKIEMTKNEAKAAGRLNSAKFNELRLYQEMYPDFEIQVKAAAKRTIELRGLDYKYMRAYILKHDASKLNTFNTLIAQDKKDGKENAERIKAANSLEVRKWFLEAFPEIQKNIKEHSDKVQAILGKVA